VFDAEGRRELAVVEGEPDLFPGFAAGDLVCEVRFVRELRWGGGEGGVQVVSSRVSALPPGRAAWPSPG
jgi:hypothetical protein